ncbi:MAG: hypothetical protein WBM40_24930 [Thiohalocapsa sp.]
MKPIHSVPTRTSALVIALGVGVIMGATAVPSFADENPDWPCEQALVPEISAAVVWDGPSVEGMSEQWQSDAEVSELVGRLVARGADPAASDALIETFAGAQPPGERDRRLTLLFAGVLDRLNADRSMLNDGILRYSRDQERRARVLDTHLAELVELESDPSPDAAKRLADLQEQLLMEQRIFDDREKTIPFLCTRPRAVEQRIGELARGIAAWLE